MASVTRREAREQAFALVFEMIFNDAPVEELIQGAQLCRDLAIDPYAVKAASLVREHREELDGVQVEGEPAAQSDGLHPAAGRL